jgi:hypothetical protein
LQLCPIELHRSTKTSPKASSAKLPNSVHQSTNNCSSSWLDFLYLSFL